MAREHNIVCFRGRTLRAFNVTRPLVASPQSSILSNANKLVNKDDLHLVETDGDLLISNSEKISHMITIGMIGCILMPRTLLDIFNGTNAHYQQSL
jgi:hypothetical protein